MKITFGNGAYRAFIVGCLCLLLAEVLAQDNKTVIGPRNPALNDGAMALKAGDAEDGIRLTLVGLRQSGSARERQTAKSNLCAGYVILEQLDTALAYCNEVLAENDRHWRSYSNRALIYLKLNRLAEAEQDLQKGEALSSNSRTLKAVRKMLLDATNPVSPSIVIDDRRQSADEADAE